MRMGVLPQGTFVTPEKRARCSPKGNFRISRREIWCAVGECLAKRGSCVVSLGHPLNWGTPLS